MKLISYMVTCGGDTGWRFSNRPAWHSTGGLILFDAEKWSVDSIADAIKQIHKDIASKGVAFTLGNTLDNGHAVLDPFIKNTEGVYVDLDYRDSDGICWLGNFGAGDEKCLHSKDHEVVRWSRNGEEYNGDYRNA